MNRATVEEGDRIARAMITAQLDGTRQGSMDACSLLNDTDLLTARTTAATVANWAAGLVRVLHSLRLDDPGYTHPDVHSLWVGIALAAEQEISTQPTQEGNQ